MKTTLFGLLMHSLRDILSISIGDMAEQLGISESDLNLMEGQDKAISDNNLDLIIKFFRDQGISEKDLVNLSMYASICNSRSGISDMTIDDQFLLMYKFETLNRSSVLH